MTLQQTDILIKWQGTITISPLLSPIKSDNSEHFFTYVNSKSYTNTCRLSPDADENAPTQSTIDQDCLLLNFICNVYIITWANFWAKSFVRVRNINRKKTGERDTRKKNHEQISKTFNKQHGGDISTSFPLRRLEMPASLQAESPHCPRDDQRFILQTQSQSLPSCHHGSRRSGIARKPSVETYTPSPHYQPLPQSF